MKYIPLALTAVLLLTTTAAAAEKPLATVNNKQITAADVESEMSGVPKKLVAGRQNEIQRAIVERLIQKRLVMEEAERLGIEENETFKAQLATLRENLIFNFVLSQKIEEKVTPENLREYYRKNKKRFEAPAIKVAHILLPTKQEAERAIKALESGKDFAEVAQATSTGPSATRGGALGWVKPGEMVKSFEVAAFALDEGEISEPVQTQFGWHVIKVSEKETDHVPAFAELEETLQRELSEKVVAEYLKGLEEKAEIKYEAN